MNPQADALWYVNNEYRKRLTQAGTFLNLLEQIVVSVGGEEGDSVAETLQYVHQQINQLVEEHRLWRYRYYYESPETKRMVQDERAILQALSRFNRMRSQHEARLSDLYNILYDMPRPDPGITRVPSGDLWTMTQYALSDLLGFADYFNKLEQAT